MMGYVHNALGIVKSKRTSHPVQIAHMTFDDRPDEAQRLQQAREKRGFANPRKAAEFFGWKYDSYIQHERGNRGLTRSAKRYAKAYGVSEAWLLTGQDDETTRVPVISWVSAGRLTKQDGVSPADVQQYVQVGNLPSGDWIALQVDGDSMDRVALDGSVIIVNRADDTLANNGFYVFTLEDGSTTFKQFKREPLSLRPFSTNLDHMAIRIDLDAFYVIGRVRRVITDL